VEPPAFPAVREDRPYVLTFAPYGYFAFRLDAAERAAGAGVG
jgi:hypothetical protein